MRSTMVLLMRTALNHNSIRVVAVLYLSSPRRCCEKPHIASVSGSTICGAMQ
jgi:hypothetical protein